MKPILLIFASSFAITIYVNSDTTILGILTSDYHVGIYAVATKIYTMVKSVLAAILLVSVPRLSRYAGMQDRVNFGQLFHKIFDAMIVTVLPAVVGLFVLSREIILFISGESYLDAGMPLRILSVALITSLFGWLYNTCVLVPWKRESEFLKATLISAALNVALNLVLIPYFKESAAAFTTLLAELCSMVMCIHYYEAGGARVRLEDRRVGGGGVLWHSGVCTVVKALPLPLLATIFTAVLGSVAVYGVILIALKNPLVLEYLAKFKQKIKRRI